MIKVGDTITITNKLSGSEYDQIKVTEVKEDQVIGIDDYENIHKVPFKFWDIKVEG